MFFRQEMKTDWIGRDFKTDVFCNSKFVDTCLEKKPSLLIDYERSVKIWMYTPPPFPATDGKKKLLEMDVSLIVNRSLRHREMLQTWFIKRKFNNIFILCIRIEDEISYDNFYQSLYAIVVGMLPTRKQEKCSFQRSPGYWNRIMYQF